MEESERLFETKAWKAYDDKHLANLAAAALSSQGEIERYFVQQMEDHRRGIAQQQERISTSQSGQAGLVSKKGSLTDELSRLKGERPALAATAWARLARRSPLPPELLAGSPPGW